MIIILSRILKHAAGDLVYKIDDSTEVGVSKKLRSPWKGPYLITEVLSPCLYRVQGRKQHDILHHDKLKLCVDREVPLHMRRLRRKFLRGESLDHSPVDVWSENLNLNSLFREIEAVPELIGVNLPRSTLENKTETGKMMKPKVVRPKVITEKVIDSEIAESHRNTEERIELRSIPDDVPGPSRVTRTGRTVTRPARFQ